MAVWLPAPGRHRLPVGVVPGSGIRFLTRHRPDYGKACAVMGPAAKHIAQIFWPAVIATVLFGFKRGRRGTQPLWQRSTRTPYSNFVRPLRGQWSQIIRLNVQRAGMEKI